MFLHPPYGRSISCSPLPKAAAKAFIASYHAKFARDQVAATRAELAEARAREQCAAPHEKAAARMQVWRLESTLSGLEAVRGGDQHEVRERDAESAEGHSFACTLQ